MAKVLILFAHPVLEKSRVHKRLLRHIRSIANVTLHDLYEAYPDMDINIKREQKLLLEHDIFIWQHPFYWYSAPAIIKQWQDLVLEHGWAYGSEGAALTGKKVFNAISCGGPRHVYATGGRNRFSIRQFLAPFDQTALLCRMTYLPPFVIHGTHKLNPEELEMHALQYEQLLVALTGDRISKEDYERVDYLNDLLPVPLSIQS